MNTIKRLNKYLEAVRSSLSNSTGELSEFWKREERKTLSRIARLT